jgi:MoaA/NifB/PqqE/SkfB family radical SAM enzyme
MRQLYFAGGEPFLIKEHFRILERCVEMGQASHIDLRYNTNVTVLPDRLFELWSHFRSVKVICSIDAYGERDEYIRHPTVWADVERHLEVLDATPDNVTVTMACCVSVLNVLHLPDFVRWKINRRFRKINVWPNGAGLINWHLVYFPPFLNVRVLPREAKDEVARRIEGLKTWLVENNEHGDEFLNHEYGLGRLDGLVRYMNEEDWSDRLPAAREFVANVDAVRGTNVLDVLPECAAWYE